MRRTLPLRSPALVVVLALRDVVFGMTAAGAAQWLRNAALGAAGCRDA